MKIAHRYVGSLLLKNLALCISALTLLFLIIDFFDRIDNIAAAKPSVWIVVQYFIFKIPFMLGQTLPISVLAATLLTIGVLSKNSELTAMRASGMSIFWICRPVLLVGFTMSLFAILLNETLVPYTTRRVREIYNLDIHKKDEKGRYSQSDFWWRSGNEFYSVAEFDSRTDTLHRAIKLETDDFFKLRTRTDAERAEWVDADLGWSMKNVTEYRFSSDNAPPKRFNHRVMPLPISEKPRDFYSAETDPDTMSFQELREFIRKQSENGLSVTSYYADLYDKLSFPFINLVVAALAIPFALKPARSGSMASSIIAGLTIGFTYYAVHSLSIAMGRAEIWPPLLAAWMASIVMGTVALFLNWGAEAPN